MPTRQSKYLAYALSTNSDVIHVFAPTEELAAKEVRDTSPEMVSGQIIYLWSQDSRALKAGNQLRGKVTKTPLEIVLHGNVMGIIGEKKAVANVCGRGKGMTREKLAERKIAIQNEKSEAFRRILNTVKYSTAEAEA